MDEQIKPVAWAVTDYQDDGPMTQYTHDPQSARHYEEVYGLEVCPLYAQQSIDALRAEVERLSALLADWHSQSVRKNGLRIQSPGHAHSKIGEWDSDNGEFAGVECAQCKLWSEAASIDSARKAAE
jgi:hypothetical protein